MLFPSFSIVLETENLATADLAGLWRSLDSLAAQDPAPSSANEVVLIDSGDIPDRVRSPLVSQYPWLTIVPAPTGITYYAAKMLGAQRVTGEIVVYADADCIYAPQWLRSLLSAFYDPQIQVVAGETCTRGIGIYGTAMALAYIFPPYSAIKPGQTGLRRSSQYYLNNVAFRREFLLAQPLPTQLPLYRGNCVIHAKQLQRDGVRIWRQPLARATHAPPHGFDHFYWRFLLIGYDYYWQQRILAELKLTAQHLGPNLELPGRDRDPDPATAGWRGKLQVLDDRVGQLIRANPWHLLFLPLGMPIVLVAVLLIGCGYCITCRRPHALLQRFNQATI